MPAKCCVWNCKSNRNTPGIRFYRFPTPGRSLSALKNNRIVKWKRALRMEDGFSPYGKRICNRHFQKGKPARITNPRDPDWIPSLNLRNDLSGECDNSVMTSKDSETEEDSLASGISDRVNENEANEDDVMSVPSRCENQEDVEECSMSDFSGCWENAVENVPASLSGKNQKNTAKDAASDHPDYVDQSIADEDGMSSDLSDTHCDNRKQIKEDCITLYSSACEDQREVEESVLHDSSGCANSSLVTVAANSEESSQSSDKSEVESDMLEKYRTELTRLQRKVDCLSSELLTHQRGFEFISESNKKCLYYTGIKDFNTIRRIFEYLEPNLPIPACHMTTRQMFVMTLTKLRLNPQFQSLAYDYNVSINTISKYFYLTLKVMNSCLKYALRVPSRDVLLRHTPKQFKKGFGDSRIFIIDCFEVRCQNPSVPKAAAQHFSNYKKSETTKFLIAICPDGNICFISSGYGGRCSDKKIVNDCGFLDLLEPGDIVLADKGFDIKDLVNSKGAFLNIPSFLKSNCQFKPAEIEDNKQITSLRIHVERCIGTLRLKYHILSQITLDSLVRFQDNENVIDLIARVCCILYNFSPSIIPASE